MTNHTVRLDHVVLRVADPVTAAGFYERTVPSVRVNEETVIDLPPLSPAERMPSLSGSADSVGHPVNHICLSRPSDAFDALRGPLAEHAVPMTGIGHDSFGARGKAPRNFYFRDPDGNVVEARHYS